MSPGPDTKTVVVIIRDPDCSNDFVVFGDPAYCYDIDLGRSDLRQEDEFAEWAASHARAARELRAAGWPDPARQIEWQVEQTRQNHGHPLAVYLENADA